MHNFDTLLHNWEASLPPLCCSFSKVSLAQNEKRSLGGLIIDHTNEKIPNISWETISNTRTPVKGLFFFDTAYTLQTGDQCSTRISEISSYFKVINSWLNRVTLTRKAWSTVAVREQLRWGERRAIPGRRLARLRLEGCQKIRYNRAGS